MDNLTKQQAKALMDRVQEFVGTLSEQDMRDLESGAKQVITVPVDDQGKRH